MTRIEGLLVVAASVMLPLDGFLQKGRCGPPLRQDLYSCAVTTLIRTETIRLHQSTIGSTDELTLDWRQQDEEEKLDRKEMRIFRDGDDKRPHEQRVQTPRTARRLNHPFKYLYRHEIPASIRDMDPMTYLHDYVGFTNDQISAMNQSFPPLLTLSVPRQLHPKLRFLRETLLATKTTKRTRTTSYVRQNAATLSILPPQFWGARLERLLAPRHAFLVYANLTHGRDLIGDLVKWNLFLGSVRKTKHFATLCQHWQKDQHFSASITVDATTSPGSSPPTSEPCHDNHKQSTRPLITAKMIEAFDALFGRGLMAAVRDELVQPHNRWPLRYIPIKASQMMELLIQHGANPFQLDQRGVSLLHWAAGTGHVDAMEVLRRHSSTTLRPQHMGNDRDQLLNGFKMDQDGENLNPSPSWENLVFNTLTIRDGASALHWASAGAGTRSFGCGGHLTACQYLLDQIPSQQRKREYVNLLTKDGNSALMWAAWSGTLETVQFLVRNRAEVWHANRNGCTVAHWASSGGSLPVCRYLCDVVGVDFSSPNYNGNTPLMHAIAFGRTEVVEWLHERTAKDENAYDSAYNLAKDFVKWTNGDEQRQQVLQLFSQDWSISEDSSSNEGLSNEELDEYDSAKTILW